MDISYIDCCNPVTNPKSFSFILIALKLPESFDFVKWNRVWDMKALNTCDRCLKKKKKAFFSPIPGNCSLVFVIKPHAGSSIPSLMRPLLFMSQWITDCLFTPHLPQIFCGKRWHINLDKLHQFSLILLH